MVDVNSIRKYLADHREVLLFLPIIVGLLFWAGAVAFAAEVGAPSPAPAHLANKRGPDLHAERDAKEALIAYEGTYEKYGLRNKIKVVSTPFFDSAAMKRIAIANAYSGRSFSDKFRDLCPDMLAGKIALVRQTQDGTFEIVDLSHYADVHGSEGLRKLISNDNSFFITSAQTLDHRPPDLRLVSWDADRPLDRVRDAAALSATLCRR